MSELTTHNRNSHLCHKILLPSSMPSISMTPQFEILNSSGLRTPNTRSSSSSNSSNNNNNIPRLNDTRNSINLYLPNPKVRIPRLPSMPRHPLGRMFPVNFVRCLEK